MRINKYILDFFTDDKGSMSMMRLTTFILVLGGTIFAFVYPEYEMGYLGIITLGLGGKVGQKYLENEREDSDTSS